MNVVFSKLREDGQNGKSATGASAAGLITLILFLVIPYTQQMSAHFITDPGLRNPAFVPPPPPSPPEQTPPQEEKQEEEKPELERDLPLPTLLEISIIIDGTPGSIPGFARFDFRDIAADDLERIFERTEIDRQPQPVFTVSPHFPIRMARDGFEGRVVLLFVVDRDGRPTEIKVESSSRSEFERPAIDALRQWRFEPGILNGVPVPVRMSLPMMFRLN